MTDGTSADGSRGLRDHFLLLLVGAGVPLLLLVLAVGLRTYERTTLDIVSRHLEAQQVRRNGLEQLVTGVRTHVSVMRRLVETRLQRRGELPPWTGRVDWIQSTTEPRADAGGVISPPGRLTEALAREVTAVEPIFALSHATHAAHPHLRWSYYFSQSRAFVSIFPWGPAAQFVGTQEPEKTFDGYYDYDVYRLGEAAANPGRDAYWTPVYLDAGGAGLMVTHASPVWDGDTFLGIVGTDVLLGRLSDYLAKFPSTAGRVVLIDQADNVVAADRGLSSAATEPTKVAALLGTLPTAPTGGHFRKVGGVLVSSVPIEGTPWRMVMTISASAAATAMAAEMWPHAALLVGILATFVGFAMLFGRKFVRPAVALAEYGAGRGHGEAGEPPPVPLAWAGLRDRIRDGFEKEAGRIRQMRAMIDGVPLRAVYVDADYVYRDANREFLAFVGLDLDGLVGRRVSDVLGPEVERQYVDLTPRIRAGETARWEGWIDYVHHGMRYLQVSILPFAEAGGRGAGFLTFTRDLTELKNAETEAAASIDALADSEALHRSIVVSALDGIIVIDEAGITREFNPAAETMFGRKAETAIGRPICDVIIPPSMREAHRDGMTRYLATGQARVVGKRIEVRAIDANGVEMPVELTVTEVSQNGRRLFTSHIRDLREQKRLAGEIEEGRNRLHQVEKLTAMGSLLASVAHELNNPLAIVIAQTTLLADKAQDDDTRKRAERIRAAADRCGRIVKSFLAMARQKPPQREALDIEGVVRSSLEMIGYGLRSAGIDVTTDFPPTLPAVLADRDLMSQVISNLILNAQQALMERPLPRRIEISARRADDRVHLRLADNGPGVPAEIAARIFDPYFTTKAAGVGTGIGLSISRSIIEAHGGELTLSDRPGGGAVFEVRIPIAPVGERGQGVGGTGAGVAALEVLVVDDEVDVGESLGEIVETFGHRVRVVEGAAAALALVESGAKIDVIFTDLRMPGFDGVDLVAGVATLRPDLAARVIIVTGDSVAGPMRLARLGRDDIVTLEKPFAPDDVRAALDRVLREG
jgi:PAS domain S-box-containing protein